MHNDSVQELKFGTAIMLANQLACLENFNVSQIMTLILICLKIQQ